MDFSSITKDLNWGDAVRLILKGHDVKVERCFICSKDWNKLTRRSK